MRNLILSAVLTVSVAIGASAQSFAPKFQTFSGFGNATTPAEVDVPSQPGTQFRLMSINYSSDTNNGVISISTGSTAYNITATNAVSSSVTNLINSTNGLSAGVTLCLEHAGAMYFATVSTWNSSTNFTAASTNAAASGGTNVVLNSGGFGVVTSVGDSLYVMTTPQTISTGAATNWLNGEVLYVGNPSRGVRVQMSTPLVTNRLSSVTGRYE